MSSSISNAINNALTGLEAFEAGLGVVSNNIANENTTGYSVETANIQTAYNGPGQTGAGVETVQITRAASGFAAAQLRTANTANAAASAQSTSLGAISSSLTNNGNTQTAMSQFFADISSLAANPSSAALRQTVLSDAQNVTTSFQSAASNITTVVTGATTSLSSSVTSANGLLAQLGNINQSLLKDPNASSLLDQQQAALNSLSQYLPVNAMAQPDGVVTIASGGAILLDQSGPQTLAVANGSGSTPSVTAGNDKTPLTLQESDGSLGADIGTITAGGQALQSLGNVATSFVSQVNQSQAQGLTEAQTWGQDLFSVPTPQATGAAGNTGTAQVSIGSITGSVALPVTLTYNQGSWTAVNPVTGASDNLGATLNGTNYGGMAFAMTGTPQNNDSFTVSAPQNAASGMAVIATSTSSIAASDPYVGTPGTLQSDGSISNNNGGTITTGTDSVVSKAQLPANAVVVQASTPPQSLQVNFGSSGAYTISVAGSATPAIASGTMTSGSSGGYNGSIYIQYPSSGKAAGQYWQLPISGSPAAGDTLTLQPGGTSSGSNAQRMASLWTAQNTTSSGSLEQSTVALATGLGANASAAAQLSTATTAQVTTATTNLSTVAGVNSDQQAVLMSNFQQAYQAAAQVITTAHSMFESLISAV